MKNKRTKLTAILLSALMAVSTISSVTWAADLFSDGSDGTEVVEETPSELFAAAVTPGPTYGEYFEDTKTETSPYVEWNGNGANKRTDGTYFIMVRYSSGGGLEETPATCVDPEPETCEHPRRDRCSFKDKYGKSHEAYYYPVKDGDYDPSTWATGLGLKKHNPEMMTVEGYDHSADCEHDGYRIVYYVCRDCGKVVTDSSGVYPVCGQVLTKADVENKFESALAGLAKPTDYDSVKGRKSWTSLTSTKEKVEESLKTSAGVTNVKQALQTVVDIEFTLQVISARGHVYGEGYITVKPPIDHEDYDAAHINDLEYWQEKANCVIDENTHELTGGALDPNKDAYYYHVAKCSICGKIVGDKSKVVKDYFWHGSMTEKTKFYKAGDGVKGFVDKDGYAYYWLDSNKKEHFVKKPTDYNSKGKLYYENENQELEILYPEEIEESKFGGVLLSDCTKPGYYYLCTADASGSTITEQEKIQPAGSHSIHLKALESRSDKNDFVLADMDGDGKKDDILVKKDEKGNYIATSVNCTKEAYFTVEERCISCLKLIASSGELKAARGQHVWSDDRQIDPTKTVYTIVDDKHHLETYTDIVTCMLCGEKGTQPSKTPPTLVSHKLIPQDIEGTRTEPSCGETGSVDRADTCICKYVDKSTTNTVIIPATDKHVFDGDPYIKLEGEAFINGADVPGISYHADVVRKCSLCGAEDSNGINTSSALKNCTGDVGIPSWQYRGSQEDDHYNATTFVPGGKWCATVHVDPDSIVPATKDPATGISYRCSTAHATIYVDWTGTVDGVVKTLDKEIRENVPYYASLQEYQARTSHTPGKPQKEGDQIVTRCTVCGDIVSVQDDNTPSVDVPTVSATSVDYDCYSAHYKALDFLFYLREFFAFRQAPGTLFSVFTSHSAELQA